MRKEIDRVFTVLAFHVMGWRHGTCDHFADTSFTVSLLMSKQLVRVGIQTN